MRDHGRAGFSQAELLDRQTPEETRDALAAIAAAARETRLLADSHIGSCFTGPIPSRAAPVPRILQRARRDAETQNRADGRFRRAQAVQQYFESVTRRNGINVRSLPNEQAALDWLKDRRWTQDRRARQDPWREKIDAGTGAAALERIRPDSELRRRAAASPACGSPRSARSRA